MKYYLGAANAWGRKEHANLVQLSTKSLSLPFESFIDYYNGGKPFYLKTGSHLTIEEDDIDIKIKLYKSYLDLSLSFYSKDEAIKWKNENGMSWLSLVFI